MCLSLRESGKLLIILEQFGHFGEVDRCLARHPWQKIRPQHVNCCGSRATNVQIKQIRSSGGSSTNVHSYPDCHWSPSSSYSIMARHGSRRYSRGAGSTRPVGCARRSASSAHALHVFRRAGFLCSAPVSLQRKAVPSWQAGHLGGRGEEGMMTSRKPRTVR